MYHRLPLSVAGLALCGVLDAGAKISLVRRGAFDQFASKMGLNLISNRRVVVEGYPGCCSTALGTMDLKLDLHELVCSVAHSFAVVEDGLIPTASCLGLILSLLISWC